jgi:hypothetical protein
MSILNRFKTSSDDKPEAVEPNPLKRFKVTLSPRGKAPRAVSFEVEDVNSKDLLNRIRRLLADNKIRVEDL